MEKWIKESLSACLDFKVPDDMVKYILSIKDPESFDEYFESLLNYEYPHHKLFVAECKQKLFGRPGKKSTGGNAQNQGKKQQNKPRENKKMNETQTIQNQGKKQQPQLQSQSKDNNSKKENEPPSQPQGGTKKKIKFVNMFTQDGVVSNTIMLKGRRICNCEARQHKLINNCLGCGKIVCEQEGSGPCLFCGEPVYTEEEKRQMRESGKKIDQEKPKNEKSKKNLEKALELRDRLLEANDNVETRNTVIDDENDYFDSTSGWLTDAERAKIKKLEEEVHEAKHMSRLKRKVTIDFAGREVVEEPTLTVDFEDKILKEIADTFSAEKARTTPKPNTMYGLSDDIDPNIATAPPSYVSQGDEGQPKPHLQVYVDNLETTYCRVQDRELMEMTDMRHCLSMHQPWASLLVEGIKRHEGRTWYSAHRGRLWIAATSKPVDMDEVKNIETFYKNHYNDDSIQFPSQYPTGCLLGCVFVQDVLSQEQYRRDYPHGESDSPFVFICEDAEKLPIVFPVKGSHKIYKLDIQVHMAALRALQRAEKIKAENETKKEEEAN